MCISPQIHPQNVNGFSCCIYKCSRRRMESRRRNQKLMINIVGFFSNGVFFRRSTHSGWTSRCLCYILHMFPQQRSCKGSQYCPNDSILGFRPPTAPPRGRPLSHMVSQGSTRFHKLSQSLTRVHKASQGIPRLTELSPPGVMRRV